MKCNRTRSYEVHKFRLKLLLLQLRCPSSYFNKCSTACICNGYKNAPDALLVNRTLCLNIVRFVQGACVGKPVFVLC